MAGFGAELVGDGGDAVFGLLHGAGDDDLVAFARVRISMMGKSMVWMVDLAAPRGAAMARRRPVRMGRGSSCWRGIAGS